MDRNSVIGFGLLAALLVGYIVYNNNAQKQYNEQKRADSVAYAKAHPKPVIDSSKLLAQRAVADTLNDSLRKAMPAAYYGTAQTVKLENKKLALEFSTKGAYPVSAQAKDYKTYDKKPLYFFNGAGNQLSFTLPIDNGSKATSDLYFTPTEKTEPNGDHSVDFSADLGNGKKVDLIYTLGADDYMVRGTVQLTGMPAANLPVNWETAALHTEKDITSERASTQVYYRFKNEDHDYFTVKGDEKKSLSDNTQWLAFRTHYFNSTLIADNGFGRVDINATVNVPDSSIVAKSRNTMELAMSGSSANFRWYIGPNEYRTLKSYAIGMDDMVPMGIGLFAFVKYINKWILIPIFYFLGSFISNYGIIIILMTIFIRLILSFFTYKSYLSAAKMRVLKPEVDELRAKYADDQQKFGMEQMKLFRTAGVNPLGGCLPTLFQIPILFAMYYLFPNFIEFRQKEFLWSHDLSTYDSIVQLPFNIPFYGDHVSLFTLLMTITSLFLALYNRNMTAQDPNNPMMKYMPFIFPIMLMGVFNKMAAALTFYYFCSNCLSILQQFIIQKYIIDEKKIHAQIQENKNKPATPSKWQQRIEEMQKGQAQRIKQQPKKN
ncbi:membrane protein insertase YidC [Chitinophagaceae bacterium MMS25-I14]